MAVGTGFGQLFRGIGQVGGVGIASSIFQTILDRELRARITDEGSELLIKEIRHSSKLVASLDPVNQRHARDSYAVALRAVFIYAAVSTALAYLVRLPVCIRLYLCGWFALIALSDSGEETGGSEARREEKVKHALHQCADVHGATSNKRISQ